MRGRQGVDVRRARVVLTHDLCECWKKPLRVRPLVFEAHFPTLKSFGQVAEPRDVGSYARYLMVVDGLRYEQAKAEAAIQDGRQVERTRVAR